MENISLNALFPFQPTRAHLPSPIRHSPSLVVNISSMDDVRNSLLASYAAGKAFLMATMRALRLKAEDLGDDVEALGVKLSQITGARGFTQRLSLFVLRATRC